MTVKDALVTYPKVEADLILEHILNKPKEFLYTHPNNKLNPTQEKTFKSLIKRRQKGEPIAYLLGYKHFYGLKFKVTKDTLIPRPETEWIVEEVLSLCHSRLDRESITKKNGFRIALRGFRNDKNINILDMGTGSGCIAISLAKHLKSAKVTASDISSNALRIAKTNAKTHKVKINFLKSNLFAQLGQKKFDIIIANLPYVPLNDYKKFLDALKFEPKLALTDGTNNFIVYKKFFEQVDKHLSETGKIFLEIDPASKTYLSTYTKKYLPKRKIKFFKDLNKLIRYVIIE